MDFGGLAFSLVCEFAFPVFYAGSWWLVVVFYVNLSLYRVQLDVVLMVAGLLMGLRCGVLGLVVYLRF